MTKTLSPELKAHIEKKKALEELISYFSKFLPAIYQTDRKGGMALVEKANLLMPYFVSAATYSKAKALRHDMRFESGAAFLNHLLEGSITDKPFALELSPAPEWRKESVEALSTVMADLPEPTELSMEAFNKVFFREHPTNRQTVVATFSGACNHIVAVEGDNTPESILLASCYGKAFPHI
ncbi:hypothetical protein [Vibrio crassostreae]|uniref:hypothetical protein n=1 Tax=Vibrio crassostreae TaxID=246167 RepID=UPI001B30E6EE|nr:hypothetical protein [Vibrio crassostreae]